jgi:hypothetical protein
LGGYRVGVFSVSCHFLGFPWNFLDEHILSRHGQHEPRRRVMIDIHHAKEQT